MNNVRKGDVFSHNTDKKWSIIVRSNNGTCGCGSVEKHYFSYNRLNEGQEVFLDNPSIFAEYNKVARRR